VYGRSWDELHQRVWQAFDEYDWESAIGGMPDLSPCLFEAIMNGLDISVCFEGASETILFLNAPPEGPPPDRGHFGGDDDLFPDCSKHLVMDAREFASAGWSKGILRYFLRGYLHKCENVVEKITIVGTRYSMLKLGLTGRKRKHPTDAFNAFVDGVNSLRRRNPIAFVLHIVDEVDNSSNDPTWSLYLM